MLGARFKDCVLAYQYGLDVEELEAEAGAELACGASEEDADDTDDGAVPLEDADDDGRPLEPEAEPLPVLDPVPADAEPDPVGTD